MNKTFNGHPIIRIEEPTFDFGGILSYSENDAPKRVAELIKSLEVGYYTIKGQEFKIEERTWEGLGKKELYLPLFQCKDNYIRKYIEFKHANEYENDLLMGLIPEEVYEEPDCRHCGDGGCIYCSPSMFI